jgi:hypothetical protein
MARRLVEVASVGTGVWALLIGTGLMVGVSVAPAGTPEPTAVAAAQKERAPQTAPRAKRPARAVKAAFQLPAETYESFAKFWSGLEPRGAGRLERRLGKIERRGEQPGRAGDLTVIRRDHPELVELSAMLNQEIHSGGGIATCKGIAWIGRDGKSVRCSGTLEVSENAIARARAEAPADTGPARSGTPAAGPTSIAAPDGPQGFCVGSSSCDLLIHACIDKHEEGGHFECHFTCSPFDGCCIGSCD